MSGDLTLPGLLERHLRERPDTPVVIQDERALSYAEFGRLVDRTVSWLRSNGIGRGDMVGVWLVNRTEWLALLFGLARLGATLVAVNTRYRAEEVEYILKHSGARMLVLQLNFRSIDFPAVLAGVDGATLPALQRVAIIDPAETLPATLLGKPTVGFDAFTAAAEDSTDQSSPDAPVAIFTTSGTTKGPKLVVHPQRTLALHARRCAAAYGMDVADARLLAAMPFCGVFGFVAMMAALAGGLTSLLVEAIVPEDLVDLVNRHAVTHVFGSDEMLRRMLELAPGETPFPSARIYGFAAFSPGALELAAEGWARRVPMLGLYGSSEVQALFSLQPSTLPLEERVRGGGLPASPDAEVRVRDTESGALLPPGVSGELEIRAPTNFIGYLNNPDATAAALGADGFFRTGDNGFVREDGTFVYESRLGDAIRLGGFLVSPSEIEDVLERVPGVREVQVVAVDVDRKTLCCAFVTGEPGSVLTEQALQQAARERIAAFKVPQRIWFIDELPRVPSANGNKIQKAKLRDLAIRNLADG